VAVINWSILDRTERLWIVTFVHRYLACSTVSSNNNVLCYHANLCIFQLRYRNITLNAKFRSPRCCLLFILFLLKYLLVICVIYFPPIRFHVPFVYRLSSCYVWPFRFICSCVLCYPGWNVCHVCHLHCPPASVVFLVCGIILSCPFFKHYWRHKSIPKSSTEGCQSGRRRDVSVI
jgi:hypothetical protein